MSPVPAVTATAATRNLDENTLGTFTIFQANDLQFHPLLANQERVDHHIPTNDVDNKIVGAV